MIKSMVCRAAAFEEPWFGPWASRLGLDDPQHPLPQRILHRKAWEWVCIAQALHERGALRSGARGLGFAVGAERLPSLFASYGVSIVATDTGDPGIAGAWSKTGQYVGALDGLYAPALLSREAFDKLVSYRHVDMRDLSPLEEQGFDFLWSACAMEHLGSLDAGLDFVVEAVRLLKPGGLAVHTTELNLSAVDETLREGATVIYRRKDLELLDARLRGVGAGLVTLDLDPGTHEHDLKFDTPPYYQSGRHHLKLLLGGFVSTSVLLIVQN